MSYDPLKEFQSNNSARDSSRQLYQTELYEMEKILGKRTATGALKLKRLKPLHRHIIACHQRGYSNRDIAHLMDITEITVSRTLNDPLAQELMKEFSEGIDHEMEGLMALGVDAIRNALQDNDKKISLKASDQLFRAMGKYNHTQDDPNKVKDTAEDVIARVLNVMENQSESIKELVRPSRPRAIDTNFVEVTNNGDDSLSD
jgi:predicted transcriptional regulator